MIAISPELGRKTAAPVWRDPLGLLFRSEPMFAAGALVLALSVLPTLLAMQFDDRTFNGVNVWDKVLKFELALAVYLATLAFFARWMPREILNSRFYRFYAGIVLACIAAEMVWIGGAAANGVGSHFNVAHPVMGAIYALMGVFAVTLTSASAVYAFAIWRNPETGLDPALKRSIVLGLGLTFPLTLIAAGYLASGQGHWVGGTPSDAGGFPLMGWSRDGGDLRVAHFFATHALHFIPVFGLVASRLAPGRGGVLAVNAFAALFSAFTLYTLAEAISGRPFLGFLF